MRLALLVLIVSIAVGCSGCTLLTVATTRSELLREEKLDTRTSHRPANVDGSECFVDQKVREVHKAHVEGFWPAGGALLALLAVVGGGISSPLGVAVIIDGSLSFGYLIARQRHESHDVRWKQTLDTRYCTVGVAKADPHKATGAAKYAPPPPRGPATRDSDGDGLNDEVDGCTLGPEDKDGFADDDGCPDDDNDRDGLADAIDKCPNDREDKDGFHDEDGCPDLDNDNDGVGDTVDKCPNEPEDKDGWNDSDGCVDPDNDADGILDTADKCPDVAEDKDGFADEDGCPDPDNDGDGVADVDDKCPAQLETKNGYQDGDGCPDELSPRVKRIVGVFAGLAFGRESKLAPAANAAIARVAAVLAAEPELRIQIDVYCDEACVDVGGTVTDLKVLSQTRADAIKDALVKRGLDVGRVAAIGFGAPESGTKSRIEIELVSAISPGKAAAK